MDFALMLVANDTSVTGEERDALSDQIVLQGCRYAVCAGHECGTWDDSIDWAHLGTDPHFNPPDDRMVMTTWHENWPLVDVVEFFRLWTAFGNFTPRKFFVLFLGESQGKEDEVRRAVLQFF